MADHELARPANEHDARLAAVAEDQGIENAYMTRAQLEGAWPEIEQPGLNRPKTPYHSRRGGRSLSEPSDSDLDPFWNTQPAQMSPGEREASHVAAMRAIAEVDVIVDGLKMKRLHEEAREAERRGEDIHPAAIWRARLEKRQRQRGR